MGPTYQGERQRDTGMALLVVMISLVGLVAVFASLQVALFQPQLSLRALTREVERDLAMEAALAQTRLLVAEGAVEDGAPVPATSGSAEVRAAAQRLRAELRPGSRTWVVWEVTRRGIAVMSSPHWG